MIFALGSSSPKATLDTLFVMFSEQDVITMRQGRTLFVDPRQLGGGTFTTIITCLNKTDADSLSLLDKSGALQAAARVDLNPPGPAANESKCKECDGCIATSAMFEDTCIVCWATEAKRFRTASN